MLVHPDVLSPPSPEPVRYLSLQSEVAHAIADRIQVVVAPTENDGAFEWLEKAYEQCDPGLQFLGVSPRYALLRSAPRFQDLLRRVGCPQ